jgi:hypothetical protein
MKSWVKRIAGTFQIGGGFIGVIQAIKSLLYANLSGTAYLLVVISCVVYAFILCAGILLFDEHGKSVRWSLWAQGLQIPFLSFPFFAYRFIAGFDANFYWIGNQGGINYYFGSRWMLLIHGASTWGIGINIFALVLFILLWRINKK